MSESKIRELLVEAVALLDTPEKWISFGMHLAEDEQGKESDPISTNAKRFAPMGAVRRAAANLLLPDESVYAASYALNQIVTARIGDQGLGLYNDQATHTQVVSLFQEAIELLDIAE